MNETAFTLDPVEFWRVHLHEKRLLQKKRGVSRVVYLLLLRWFEKESGFPEALKAIPLDLITHGIALSEEPFLQEEFFLFFEQEKTIRRYQQEILDYFEFKPFDKSGESLQEFLLSIIFKERNDELIKDKTRAYLKKHRIENPGETLISELVKNLKSQKEQEFFAQIDVVLSDKDQNYIDDYLISSPEFEGVCQFLRQDSGASTRDSVRQEINRLNMLNKLPIASLGFIEEIHVKHRNFYRRRFLTDTPERARRRTSVVRYGLAAIFCYQRHQEALDNLVEHLVSFIHRIKKTEETKKARLNKEIGKRLGDLETLYRLAEINRDNPKEIIENAVYPNIPQADIDKIIQTRHFANRGKELIRESTIKRYSMTYRHTLFEILNVLSFESNNQEFLLALQLIKQRQNDRSKYYPSEIDIPLDGLISKQEQKFIVELDELNKSQRVLRKEYESAVFKLLRIKLRHKEVWISGAFKYRNPIEDLPKDFEENREEYFSLMGQPLLAKTFTDQLRSEMRKYIGAFDQSLPENKLVHILKKKGKTWILLSPLQKVEEPKLIQRMKEAISNKWGIIDLLDILKEVDLRENFTSCISTAGNREILDRETIRKRLLLCIFAIGTNTGLKRTAGASKGSITFEELRHIKKFFMNKDDLREGINTTVNAIFRVRNPKIWRSVSTACAADSKQFSCFEKNLITEWSPRHHDSGVMIYWHVSDQYVCVYSQLKTCTSSEVASMLQGITSQETDMDIESQYVDSHGKSELGFALSYLEKFDLLPRYKTIGSQKLYLPEEDFQVKNIEDIMTRAIDWQVIEDQYDEMIKHAVALKIGTATAETIIRKFARSHYQHPTFKAFMELGKAIKTIFLCRYLNSVELRQQINAGLNVVENWNSANAFVYYGKSAEISSNDRDEQEISMLCLHLLQTSISYVNTLLVEDLLEDEHWRNQMGPEDYRALTALFYLHINPYGTFELDLEKRLMIKKIQEEVFT